MHLLHFLSSFISEHAFWAYGILFLGMVVEGEFVLLVSGIATHLHITELGILLPVLILGATAKIFLGYLLGTVLKRKFGHHALFHFFERKVLSLFPDFTKRPFWSIFLSKFLYGINHFTIIFSGYQKIHFPLFLKAECISSTVWFIVMFLLGYLFSYAALSITHTVSTAFLILSLFVFLFIFIQRIFNTAYEVREELHHSHGS